MRFIKESNSQPSTTLFDSQSLNSYKDVPIDIDTELQDLADNSLANEIRNLINKKNEFIEDASQFIVDLDAYNPNDDIKSVMQNMVTDENKAVGQLQAILSILDDNAPTVEISDSDLSPDNVEDDIPVDAMSAYLELINNLNFNQGDLI